MDIQHLGMFFAKSNFQMWLGVQPVGLLCVVRRAGSWCGLKNLGLLWALWTLRHADCSSTTMVPWADFSYLIIRNAFCLWISAVHLGLRRSVGKQHGQVARLLQQHCFNFSALSADGKQDSWDFIPWGSAMRQCLMGARFVDCTRHCALPVPLPVCDAHVNSKQSYTMGCF